MSMLSLLRTLALVKPSAMSKMGAILEMIYSAGFHIAQLKMTRVTRSEALEFYAEHAGKPFLDDLLSLMTSGPVLAMELVGSNAVAAWRELLGPTDPAQARTSAPQSIRAQFGSDTTNNAAHGSDSTSSAARELDFFFPSGSSISVHNSTAQCGSDSTLCLVKPHAVQAGLVGKIVNAVCEQGFQVTAVAMFSLDTANSEEFLEVYKGVVAEYNQMVTQLTSGPCVALELTASNAHSEFREFCGPADPVSFRQWRKTECFIFFNSNCRRSIFHGRLYTHTIV